MERKQKNVVNKSYNKTNLLIICMICLLLIVVIGVTYVLYSYMDLENGKNDVKSGSISLNYTEDNNSISIQNSLPISDSVGKGLQRDESDGSIKGHFDFNVSCEMVGKTTINYEVYALKQTIVEELSEDYVKIYLTDGEKEEAYPNFDGRKVPVYSDLKVASSEPAGKRLYFGEFTSSGVQNFRLRMWLADTYTVNAAIKTFTIKINVKTQN